MSKSGLTDKEWEKFALMNGRFFPEQWVNATTREPIVRDKEWVLEDFRANWKRQARETLADLKARRKYGQSLVDEAQKDIDKIQAFIEKAGGKP